MKKTVKKNTVSKVVTLGGYGCEAIAQQDCDQYMHPNVFMYRSAIFPNPANYGITALVKAAKPILLKTPQNPINPWGIKLNVVATGAKAANWMTDFENRIRIQRA